MTRHALGLILVALLAAACGGSDEATSDLPLESVAATSCLVDDPNCADGADGGAAGPVPSAISIGEGSEDGSATVPFGGFFYSDGEVIQLCSALAESFPPQCGAVVIDINTPLDIVLEHVAESFGNPDDATLNIESGIYWTNDWINLSGRLENNQLVLE